ncbi:MAG: hypothetical protein EOP83_18845 [Verrucomicrobiaceae bacterium]|nr:MAG: hypothetical protein EOP83_18845 [Verrucomicrobiaceae bacterium]
MNFKDLTGKSVRQEISDIIHENASSGATGAASVATVTGGKDALKGAIGVGFDPNGHDRGIYPAPSSKNKSKSKKTSGTLRR